MTSDISTGTAQEAVALRADLLRRVEDRLRSLLDAERGRWAGVHEGTVVPIDALSELIASGGKRIRPAFCVTGYLAAGGDPGHPGIVAAGAALEMLHLSALVHDDVLDDSGTRRGLPTVHTTYTRLHAGRGWQGEARRYGEGVALLVGDLALVYSDELMAQAPSPALPEWHRLRSEVMIGQYMDVHAAAEFCADARTSRLIARIKSGRYTIHRPLVVGASAAGRGDLAAAFEEYGEAVGEAFQLRDDLLDAFGDTAATGKPTGLDFTQHKMTLLLGWAMQRDEHIHTLITEPGHTPGEVRRRLLDTGVPRDVERHIDGLVERGRKAIADAPLDEVWRTELADMARRVAYRTS
ncbi:polyprenyl synthetase family protein [Streptomyces sp. YS415]|uniref:polyprenyl synthetase family protein n=1 Tax=Streptomyces sp. YS415 TaxID=2944806 RepID=UPI002020EF0E|nr:polyprenyl synthetase family protein [Streptomyces sp. YS415]MCL7425730.1 polyprenyl synthetase family protein [Streptomyces sp. YS415]